MNEELTLMILNKYKELYALDEQLIKLITESNEINLQISQINFQKDTIRSLIAALQEKQKKNNVRVQEDTPKKYVDKTKITMVPSVNAEIPTSADGPTTGGSNG